MDQKPFVGIWLDHRKARLFWADKNADIDLETIESNYQEEGEPTDSMRKPNVASGAVAHASVEHRRHEQLKRFYKKLNKVIKRAKKIYLFGPGQAKKEFASILDEDKSLNGKLHAIDNADKKMTEPQMMAKVRETFKLPRE